MTAVTMPAPAVLQTPPPSSTDGGDGDRRRPAPVASILAALARLSSHAGDPATMTVTGTGHAAGIAVDGREQYLAWRRMLAAGGAILHGDDDGALCESQAVLHGWALTLRIVRC